MKYGVLGLAALLGITSCGVPGRKPVEAAPVRPSQVSNFQQLFSQNCSACHGPDGQGALTVGIGRPLYLAIADDATMRRTIEEGRPGTAMAAFAKKAGGMLTEAQIEILVRGLREHSAKPDAFKNEKPPPYASSRPGDVTRGQQVFSELCSSCHGPDGRGERAIADNAYLALVSDQHLRTVIIVGMPNLGMPDWRDHGKPLSDADLTDVVAWLAAQRTPVLTQSQSTALSARGGSQ